jgi:hypothetical protein
MKFCDEWGIKNYSQDNFQAKGTVTECELQTAQRVFYGGKKIATKKSMQHDLVLGNFFPKSKRKFSTAKAR